MKQTFRVSFVVNWLVFIIALIATATIKLLLWLDSPLYSVLGYLEIVLFFFAVAVWFFALTKKGHVCPKSLFFIVVFFPSLTHLFAFPHFRKAEVESPLRIINYNVHVFNSYSNLRVEGLKPTTEMIDWVVNCDADILCLQEFYTIPKSKKVNVLPALKKKYPRHYFDIGSVNGSGNAYGAIVFSKFPIINYSELKNDKAVNGSFFIDIIRNTDTIRIYACHLQSNRFKETDIDSINTSEGQKSFLSTYFYATKIRINQANELLEHAKSCPYPFIICGDFNDTPISVVYKTLASEFTDSFLESGLGYGATFHHPKLPDMRIDYQFHSKEFVCNEISVKREMAHSDHYPLVGVYSLKKHSN